MPASCWPPKTSTAPSRSCRPTAPRSSRSRPTSRTGCATAPCATLRATWSASRSWRDAPAPDRFGARSRVRDRDDRSSTVAGMTPEEIADLAHLRRARDLMDRQYAEPLDVPAMARAALMSPAHFSRKFRAAYGETPYSYLMTRRIERAKALLRQGMSVTGTCVAVGCTSLGSFSSRFTENVGETPSQYRARDHRGLEVVPPCVTMIATRPLRTGVTV